MKSLGIGLIGTGTVGSGVISLYRKNGDRLLASARQPMHLHTVCDLDFSRCPHDLSEFRKSHDWEEVINDPQIQIVVEVIGGEETAKRIIEKALQAGKHVVTANKLLMAKHGASLLELAAHKRVFLMFEASVGGAIPMIAPLGMTLLPNHIQAIYGIVNGTTNFILSQMQEKSEDFSTALLEAQRQGYAEADPSSDIDGYDSLFKLCVLASMAFQAKVSMERILLEGIRNITPETIRFVKSRNQVIKLLAMAQKKENGLEMRVHPVALEKSHPLAMVNDTYNAIYVKADCIGEAMFYGRGAGGVPTASSIWADLLMIVNQTAFHPLPLQALEVAIKEELQSRFYLPIYVGHSGIKRNEIQEILERHEGKLEEIFLLEKEEADQKQGWMILTGPITERVKGEIVKALSLHPGVIGIGNVLRMGIE